MSEKPLTARELDKILRKFEVNQVKVQKKRDLEDLQREIDNLFR